MKLYPESSIHEKWHDSIFDSIVTAREKCTDKRKLVTPGWYWAFNPSSQEGKTANLCELQASLIYRWEKREMEQDWMGHKHHLVFS